MDSTNHMSFKYDVFLSFSGEDVRKTFIDHLHAALKRQGIETFKDDVKLEKGKVIKDELLKSIENSKLYIIVFSKRYASSSWCLNELVKILECNKMAEHTTYPVFYDVEPTHIRKQSAEFGKAFAIHEKEDVRRWREALNQAANLAGWELKNTDDGCEAKLIERIVEKISLELCSINMIIDRKLVGMEHRIENVLSSLETSIDDVRMIGIKGIGGGGKTTLARAVFDRLSIQFEGQSFVENVREVSRQSVKGLMSLQQQVILDVSNDRDIILTSVDNGKNILKSKLGRKKVLVVLDDVDDIKQLEALAGERNWFKAGSRIIITARDEQVLKPHGVMLIHDVELLSDEDAKCLFNRHAFRGDMPTPGYEELSLKAVRYAGGLPLLIRDLGLFLYGKDKLEWEDQLKRLNRVPLKEALVKLELSYSGLDDDQKELFLDIACFLTGLHKEDASRILECCGFNAKIGLKVLELKSLITFSNDQHLGMHKSIQDMGRYIVRRSHPDYPNKHSRLWIQKEIEEILADGLGTELTTGIAGDDRLSSESVANGFGKMERLRFLQMVSKKDDNAHQMSQDFPKALRYLNWDYYPHISLPKTFQPNNLVALEMPDCRIERLWEGDDKKVLTKLRFLVLEFSKLTYLDLGLTPNLEKLDLKGCEYLKQVDVPRGCLQKLVSLNLSGCSSIISLLFITQLESLRVLHLTSLLLKDFPYTIPGPDKNSLVELRFGDNDIKTLPASIGNLQKLEYLDLKFCTNLKQLPASICDLRCLRKLELYGCILEELPSNIGYLECLEKLNLSYARIRHLPESIRMLKNMKTLDLSFCSNLEKLPGDLGKLECLEALILERCNKVKDIPDSICMLKCLKVLSLLHCIGLEKLPQGLENLYLEELNVKGTRITHLPKSILSKCLKIDGASPSSRALQTSSSKTRVNKVYALKESSL